MNIFRTHSIYLIFLLLFSCGKPEDQDTVQPVACFESTDKASVGTTVEFNSSCSKNGTSYLWDFGGIGTSSDPNPTFTFTSPGTVKVKLIVSNNVSKVSFEKNITIEANSSCIEHRNQTINTAQTWKTGETHCISGHLWIEGATLTIEPGVIVRLYKDAMLVVGYQHTNSVLIAEGSVDKPILFTSAEALPAPGDWISLVFYKEAGNTNKLSHCIFEYGGSQSGSSIAGQVGMIELSHGGTVSIDNCTFRKGQNSAILMDSYSGLTSFSSNTITDVSGYAILTSVLQLHTFGTGNIISNKGILVSGGYLNKDVTWNNQTCPFYFYEGFAIGSSSGNTLTLSPGMDMRIHGSIEIGTYGTKGRLIAAGTATQKISFGPTTNVPVAGDWDGFIFGTGTLAGTKLTYSTIKYAGGDAIQYGALNIENSNVSIDNTEISNCKGIGINMDSDYNPSFASFTNNVINTPGGYPLNILSDYIPTIGENNTFISPYPVPVMANKLSGLNIIWRNVGVPYLIKGNILIGYNTDYNAETSLTIEQGCVLKFNANSGLTIFNHNHGTFKAVGTADKPIVFTSSKAVGTQAPGDWNGIEFYNRTKAGSVMDYCQVLYGGGRYANLTLYEVSITGEPVIKNCTFSNSKEYGVKIIQCTPTLSNNSYSNNTVGNIGNF